MEKYELTRDMNVFCVTADSFPDGICDAFEELNALREDIRKRPFFGISYKNKEGMVVYKASVLERFEGEGDEFGLEVFVIKKGIYLTETIVEFSKQPDVIGACFQKLLADPRLDATFPCVEWYKTTVDDVVCMVKIIESGS